MKKKFKKIFSIIFAAVILICSAPLTGLVSFEQAGVFSSNAQAATEYVSGNFRYTLDSEGNATIFDFVTAPEGEVVFPETVDGHPVTVLDINSADNKHYDNLTGMTIPKYVIRFNLSGCRGSGIINYNAVECYWLGVNFEPEEFHIGPDVKVLSLDPMAEYPLDHYLFAETAWCKITVDPANTEYTCDEKGVLFNKDKTRLLKYPHTSADTEYTVPESVKIISAGAFYDCANLKKIELSNVEEIELGAFWGCVNLEDFTLSDKIKRIGSMAFLETARYEKEYEAVKNNSETEIYFENHLISYDCDNSVTSYDIRPGTKTIAGLAFREISSDNFKTVTIPESVCYIGFEGITISGIQEVIVHPDNPYYTNGENGEIYSKDMSTLVRYPYYKLVDTKVTIPAFVDRIDNCAFMSCGLFVTEMNIPDTVKEIGSVGLAGTAITTIKIPSGIEKINYATFFFCSRLESIYLPKSLKYIGMMAFCECESLTDVYFEGTEEEWNKIIINDMTGDNYPLLNATIHFNSEYHVHSYTETVTKAPTCTESGTATYTCECGDTYTATLSASHTPVVYRIEPTCKENGVEYSICEKCGSILSNLTTLPKSEHIPGEWIVTVEPTTESDGEKIKKCTVCQEVLEVKVISSLTVFTDNNTGVKIEYPASEYDGEVNLNVDHTYDGVAIHFVNTKIGPSDSTVYNITLTVDGVQAQPNGNMTICLPLPEGYEPESTFVYYLNIETGVPEMLSATYKDGYMVFTINHFSYYALVQKFEGMEIRTPSTTAVSYGDKLVLHADYAKLPDGAYIEWTASNQNFTMEVSEDGKTCTISPDSKGDTTFIATVYDKDGNEIGSDEQVMTSKAGFFQKLIAFFKKLFGLTKTISEIFKF